MIGPHTKDQNVNAYAGTADKRAADLLWALEVLAPKDYRELMPV
ncbi:hypothetical protein [Prevotella sp. tc2-28]|nr:hypothetical protein [Prevotella sp. tc2-28]